MPCDADELVMVMVKVMVIVITTRVAEITNGNYFTYVEITNSNYYPRCGDN